MAGYRYSLALVSVVMKFPNKTTPVRFGGQGSMIGNVTLSRKNDRFSAEGDATGGFVINETLDKTGTCVISIKQFAPLVSTLTNLFNQYDSDSANYESVEPGTVPTSENLTSSTTIELYYAGVLVGTAQGCYLNMPELPLEEENSSRDFSFECGVVDFNMLNNLQASITIDTKAITKI